MTIKEFENSKGAYTETYLKTLAVVLKEVRDACQKRSKSAFDLAAYAGKLIKNQWGGINSKIMDLGIEIENYAFKRNVDYQLFNKTSAFDDMVKTIEDRGGAIFKIIIENMRK